MKGSEALAGQTYVPLKAFRVSGAAFGFVMRRFETVARVAFLPIALMLVFDVAAVFGVLSVANEKAITFADLPQGATFQTAVTVSQRLIGQALAQGHLPVLLVAGASFVVNVILVASLMAPLIRYAGLGERPAQGLVRAPFGPDQVRYVGAQAFSVLVLAAVAVAPAWAAFAFVAKTIDAALSRTYASFPNADSLHTIVLVPASEALSLKGELWLFSHGYFGALAAGAALIVFVAKMIHFRPAMRATPSPANPVLRGGVLLASTLLLLAVLALGLLGRTGGGVSLRSAEVALFMAGAYVILAYLSVRFAPYPGLAVCRKSMSFRGLFALSRGFNLFRLGGAILLVWIVITATQLVVEGLILPLLAATVNSMFQASTSMSALFNDGEAARGVLAAFVWIWTAILICYKFLWLFFTYGAWAGLFGRLYRESAEVV